VRVVDLSADLRLADGAAYERWYGRPHPAPGLLPVPYGLPELGRDALRGARAVANPGCYATAVLLALAPLARSGQLAPAVPLIVDAKSGVSGAGRAPRADTAFCEVHGNCSPYNPGRRHRHVGEMEQVLAACGLAPGRLLFTPHLLPTDRGILADLYLPVADAAAAASVLAEAYAGEPLVEVLPEGELATLAHVVGSPRAVLSATPLTPQLLLVVSALDNLLKGAATQAVQNFNLMWGLPETAALVAARRAA
jgi:N-acetyl-gamma-glutamyl-phosphate reductase